MTIVKANVASQMAREGGIPQIFTRNQPVTTQWVDQSGKPVTLQQMQSNNFTSVCNYDLPAYCNLVQYARVYRCGNTGYFLQFEYEIFWNNNVVPTFGGNYTAGFIEIVSDATGNTVQSLSLNATNCDVRIVEIGPDPNPSFPNNHIFRVKFVTTDNNPHLVPTGYINGDLGGTYTVKLSATFVTDCKNGGAPYSLWLLPVTTYGFTGDSGNDPCKRNEKGWVTPAGAGGTGTNMLTIAGWNPLGGPACGYGGSFITPDLQQVQYNIDGSILWNNMSNYSATGLPIFGQPYIRSNDFATTPALPSGNHLIGVRYRNWKYIGTNPLGWPIPNFTADCFSPGDNPSNNTSSTPYSTFAYQYWPCIIP